MMFIIEIYCILFALLTWHRFEWALILLFTLLPTYLIRFQILSIPTTLLEVMIWIIALVWIIKNYKLLFNNFKKLPLIFKENKSIILATSLFIIGTTISIFTSIDLRAALGEWKAFYIEPVIIFFILVQTLTTSEHTTLSHDEKLKLIDKILFGLIITGLAVSILSIYQHFTGWMVPYSFWQNRNTYRVTAWYGFPNGVGLFLAPLIPMAIYLIKKYWEKFYSFQFILSTLFIPLSILAIIYAKSTGAMVGIAAGLGLLLLCYKKTRIPAIILGITALAIIFSLPASNSVRTELLAEDRSGQLRVNIWAETSAYLMQHPIKGAGLADYAKIIYPYRIDKTIEVFHHPHNLLLTIWVNTGLIGLIGFVWIIVWFYRVGISQLIFKNKKQQNSLTPFLLSTMSVYLTTGLVDSPYIKNDLSILFWLLPALMLTNIAYGKMENSKTKKIS